MDLAEVLTRGALDDSDVRSVAVGALEALSYAHARGVVHRDVKPANLFLVAGDPRRLKLVDFGIAHLPARTAITGYGTVVGTPGYMAPEQARGARALGPTADLFALGCVLFECVAGHPAFIARDALALLFKIMVEDPPSLLEVRPGVSPALAHLVARMLSKEIGRRPASAQAVLAWLDAPDLHPAEEALSTGAITAGEQQLVSVILGAGQETSPNEEAPTLDAGDLTAWRERADAALRSFGARVEWLADGGLIVVLRGGGSASAQVALAAGCALALRGRARREADRHRHRSCGASIRRPGGARRRTGRGAGSVRSRRARGDRLGPDDRAPRARALRRSGGAAAHPARRAGLAADPARSTHPMRGSGPGARAPRRRGGSMRGRASLGYRLPDGPCRNWQVAPARRAPRPVDSRLPSRGRVEGGGRSAPVGGAPAVDVAAASVRGSCFGRRGTSQGARAAAGDGSRKGGRAAHGGPRAPLPRGHRGRTRRRCSADHRPIGSGGCGGAPAELPFA